MNNELNSLKLENIGLKLQILESQFQILKSSATQLQADRAVIIEAMRVEAGASPEATFNPTTLAFDEPKSDDTAS